MVVWLSAAICSAPCSWCWLAFRAGPLGPVPGAGGLVAGGLDGVGGPVVLAGLPDGRVGVVLAAVVDGVPLGVGVGVEVVEHVGQAGVVVAVAGVKVAAEAVGDLVEGPVAELMTAEGGWGLQVLQQLCSARSGVAVGLLAGVWRLGWGGV
jgi:hypothetical protein